MGNQEFGVSHEATTRVANQIATLQQAGFQIGIVIGGGNLFRGIQQVPELGIERTPADQIGILSTLINGVVLKQALMKAGCSIQMVTALECPRIAESYRWDLVMNYLSQGEIVLFVGGTGHPYFTTDTTAALRACEIKADIFLKATTRVDAVYNKDPRQHPDAQPYSRLTFQEVLQNRLKILDLSAITLCMQSHIPIRVFNFFKVSLIDALSDKAVGTIITE